MRVFTVTEPLAFTLCNVELHGKAIVALSRFGAHVLGRWSTAMSKKKRKAMSNKIKRN